MELYNALKKVVELQNEEILKDVKLINILSDFRAYDDVPSSKYLLKYMISEGLMANLLYEYQSQDDFNILLDSHKTLLTDTYGYKDSLAEYVVRSLAYALGWTSVIPSINNPLPNTGSINIQPQTTIINPSDDGRTHLSFRQLPINGSVSQFIANLETVGYTQKFSYSHEKRTAVLTGSFAGVNNCEIYVVGTPLTETVCRVIVYFPEQKVWYNIKSEYNKWKDKFTSKYGKPNSYEFFSDPFYEGDGSEMTALYSEHCTYASYFNDNESGGTIVVKMTTYYCVAIIYEDKYNTEIDDKEKNTIEDNDI